MGMTKEAGVNNLGTVKLITLQSDSAINPAMGERIRLRIGD